MRCYRGLFEHLGRSSRSDEWTDPGYHRRDRREPWRAAPDFRRWAFGRAGCARPHARTRLRESPDARRFREGHSRPRIRNRRLAGWRGPRSRHAVRSSSDWRLAGPRHRCLAVAAKDVSLTAHLESRAVVVGMLVAGLSRCSRAFVRAEDYRASRTMLVTGGHAPACATLVTWKP